MEIAHLGTLRDEAAKIVHRALHGESTRVINDQTRLVVAPATQGLFPDDAVEDEEDGPLDPVEAPSRD